MDIFENLKTALADFSARDMSMLNGSQIIIEPHRINDSSDKEQDWVFKITTVAGGKIINSKLI